MAAPFERWGFATIAARPDVSGTLSFQYQIKDSEPIDVNVEVGEPFELIAEASTSLTLQQSKTSPSGVVTTRPYLFEEPALLKVWANERGDLSIVPIEGSL